MKNHPAKNNVICAHHEFIIEQIQEIKDFNNWVNKLHNDILNENKIKNNKEELRIAIESINEICENILKSAKIAIKQGQSMEDRLLEYYNAINRLGFIRKQNKC